MSATGREPHHVFQAVGVPIAQQRRALVVLELDAGTLLCGKRRLKKPYLHCGPQHTVQPLLTDACIRDASHHSVPATFPKQGQPVRSECPNDILNAVVYILVAQAGCKAKSCLAQTSPIVRAHILSGRCIPTRCSTLWIGVCSSILLFIQDCPWKQLSI